MPWHVLLPQILQMTPLPKGAAPSQTILPAGASTTTVANPAAKASGARPNKHDELRLLVNSRHPIITVETPEEERLEQLLFDIANELEALFLRRFHGDDGMARI